MKKLLYCFICAIMVLNATAQVPQGISHQAVIRNASQQLIAESPVGVRVSILQGGPEGTALYQETHTLMSNINGLITFIIGQGTVLQGVFSDIPWETGSFFIRTEVDPEGGSNYTIGGTSQLLSVPYALFSSRSGALPDGVNPGDMYYWNGSSWEFIPIGEYGQALIVCDGIPTWGGCLPKVTTAEITNNTGATATSGGVVVNDGGIPVTQRGVCWNTTPSPTVSGFFTIDGNGAGSFTSIMTGLLPGTQYFVRAYGINGKGTAYGDEVTFTTLAAPVVVTAPVTEITGSTAVCGGNVTSEGGAPVTVRGVCWSTSPNPTTANSKTEDGGGAGSFVSQISGLAYSATYFVRAYATNSAGTTYGNEYNFQTPSFSCGEDQVTDIDGNVYPTVLIGSQCWMTENLKTTKYRNAEPLQYLTSFVASTTGAYGYIWGEPAWGVHYGALYNYYAVGSENGLCPEGWHVPTDAEWTLLTGYISAINNSNIGNQLKSCRQVDSPLGGICNTNDHPRWNSNTSHHGTDDFGFSAYGGGQMSSFGLCTHGYWWSSTVKEDNSVWYRGIFLHTGDVFVSYAEKNSGFSVRCLKGEGNEPVSPTIVTDSVTDITQNSATSGGIILDDGGSAVTSKGVVFSTSPNPTLETNQGYTTDGSGSGSFSSSFSGLLSNTTYYVRAYATNSVGTAYGQQISFMTLFQCGGTITDADNNTYNTVAIGSYCWMKENLKTTVYRNGTPIDFPGSDNNAWATNTTGAYAWYDNDIANKSPYGALYNWHAVNHSSGLCPEGWHVCSHAEFSNLEGTVDTQYGVGDPVWDIVDWRGFDAGKNLKSETLWMDNGNGPNTYGFTLYPAGRRALDGSYQNLGYQSYIWLSDSNGNDYAWSRYFRGDYNNIRYGYFYNEDGRTVRCVKD